MATVTAVTASDDRSALPWLFAACGLGMALGALIDTRTLDAQALIALCSDADAVRRWRSMWSWMPATHTLMLLAGIGAALALERRRVRDWPLRCCVHGACLLAMVVGMAVGTRFALPLANALGSGLAGLMAGMGAGMAAAMLLVAPWMGCRRA